MIDSHNAALPQNLLTYASAVTITIQVSRTTDVNPITGKRALEATEHFQRKKVKLDERMKNKGGSKGGS